MDAALEESFLYTHVGHRIYSDLEKIEHGLESVLEAMRAFRDEEINILKLNYNLLGYFEYGDIRWILVGIDEDMLKGIDITPKGEVHMLNINKKEVCNLVIIDDNK